MTSNILIFLSDEAVQRYVPFTFTASALMVPVEIKIEMTSVCDNRWV